MEYHISTFGQDMIGYSCAGMAIAYTDLSIFWLLAWASVYLWIKVSQPGVFVFWLTGFAMTLYVNEKSYQLLFQSQGMSAFRASSMRVVPLNRSTIETHQVDPE